MYNGSVDGGVAKVGAVVGLTSWFLLIVLDLLELQDLINLLLLNLLVKRKVMPERRKLVVWWRCWNLSRR
jgi:hypothetical protein